ncbi:MAG: hypothetical protein ACJLS2_09860 [Microcella pacifica]
MENVTFSRDVAERGAQLSAVLVIAFVVEARSLGERRAINQKEARWLVWYVFVTLSIVFVTAAAVVNGPPHIHGWAAVAAWSFISAGTLVLVTLVGIAAWANIRVSSDDGSGDRTRRDFQDRFLKEPGWRWLLFGGLRSKRRASSAAERGGDST